MAEHRYVWDAAAGVFRCTWSGCDYAKSNPMAVRMHHLQAHEKVGPGGRRKTAAAPVVVSPDPVAPGPAPAVEKCPDCGGSRFRLLRQSIPAEGRALLAGYNRICADPNCKELIE